MGMITDRMKDFEDVTTGKRPSRIVGAPKKKPKKMNRGGPMRAGYKHGGPVCRADRT